MNDELNDLISVPLAAERAGVSRNTMHRAAKNGKVKAVKLGRDWYVYSSDLERWKAEHYRPDMARRYPIKPEGADENTSE